jgi:probable F420-dependent oxidoreductase
MKVGILLNVNNFTIDPATLARGVEAAGFESLWVGDHPVIPVSTTTPMRGTGEAEIPEAYAHVSDPFVALAMAAASTTTLKVGTGICIVAVRHPILTALQVATLDYFSGGRFLFGVGAGWLREELELFGVDYSRRLAQAREYVEAMRVLWRDPEASFEGEWVSFPPVRLNPRPAQEGGPRVLLGTWGPKAVERVAEWADGWIPMLLAPDALKVELGRLRSECEKRGRDATEIEVTIFEYDPGGDREASQEYLAGYADAGAHRLVLIQGLGDHMGSREWTSWSTDRFREQLSGVAERFLP